jgi:hypothetical protein
MNALIVLNIGGTYLTEHARESFADAARRWGVEYVELTKPTAYPHAPVKLHHFWRKTFLWQYEASQYGRVAVLDADMLIRGDCPSLFAEVPPDKIGVISRCQKGFNADPQNNALKDWARITGLPCPPPDKHLNGGLVVYDPHLHSGAMSQWQHAGRRVRFGVSGMNRNDQGALSVVLAAIPGLAHWLPWQFNTIFAGTPRAPHSPLGKMASYIYHFNGTHKDDNRARLLQCEWRI